MNAIEITDLDDQRIAPYSNLTDAQLRNRLHPENGLVIVESPKVIRIALDKGWKPVSLLSERRHIDGDAADIIVLMPGETPIFTGSRELLAKITGYKLTRGVLCAMRRKPTPDPKTLLDNARRICIIDEVSDTTNIGAIFRGAAALGIDAVLLTRNSCDPLNRRSIRVSMGTVFLVPWGWIESVSQVKSYGFKTIAMALRDNSRLLSDAEIQEEPRLAIIMGSEGYGLPDRTIDEADFIVKIPMHYGVDSLNVAAASAIAFYELCK